MKKILTVLCLMCAGLNLIFAQLALQKVNGKKTKTISLNTDITIRYPSRETSALCDCYTEYQGLFKGGSSDSIAIALSHDYKVFGNENGVTKSIYQKYGYDEGKEVNTILRTNSILSITKKSENMEALNNFGGVMIILALLNQFIVSPFYNPEVRGTSDKITGSVFAAGITLTLLSNKKTY